MSSPLRSRRGLTLVELLVSIAMAGILFVAIGYAFTAGLDTERVRAERRQREQRTDLFEDRIRQLLTGAKLRETSDDEENSYFIGETEGGDDSLGCDRLTFTTVAPSITMATQASTDDFETQNAVVGPVGGLAEVSLGLLAVGDAGDLEGVFERIQRPSDSDPTQGGDESQLSAEVSRIGFQFWDGEQWTATWDTQNGAERRLPAAVLVQYVLRSDDTETIRQILVRIPASDVDANNPVVDQVAQ